MKLYVLDLGKIVMKSANPVTQTDGNGDESPAIPIHSFLIDAPIGKILFDAGCHPEAMEGAWPKAMCQNPYVFDKEAILLKRLDAIGVKAEEIQYLVLSHLHLDHAGCVHLFPNAAVYVQEQELEQTMADYRGNCLDAFHLPCDVENWIRSEINWQPVNADREAVLCEGVTILDLKKGHSFGMLGLCVELNSGNVLLVSDAAYSAFHYGPPAKQSGAVYDEEGYFEAMEFIRRYAKSHKARVLYGHDMEQFQGLMKSSEGYYE